jgi:hypothetical protein
MLLLLYKEIQIFQVKQSEFLPKQVCHGEIFFTALALD